MSGRRYLSPDSSKSSNHSHRPIIESPPHHRREIQSLLSDNQRLAATHVALKQELTVALQDLRHFSAAAGKIKAERDAEVREVFEKAIKMEAEVRLIGEFSADLVQVRSDVQKLTIENKEFVEKLDKLNGEITKDRDKVHEFLVNKAEIEAMRKEIHKGRAAVEYEKKVHAANIEQGQAMEKSRISMAREIEKLQSDLADANKKSMAAAAAAATNTPGTVYGAGYGNHDMGYGGNAYTGPYVGHQVPGGVHPHYGSGPMPQGPYGVQHHMVNPQYAPGPAPHGVYGMQHPNAHR